MTNGISYDLIIKAVSGDIGAVEKITRIYQPYINSLASKRLFDEDGNEFIGIDVDAQERLQSKLLDIISKFKIA